MTTKQDENQTLDERHADPTKMEAMEELTDDDLDGVSGGIFGSLTQASNFSRELHEMATGIIKNLK